MRKIAMYMPSAKSEPCARLMVSITPTMSMKPSAIRANSSPSDTPLTRCGRSCANTSTSDFVAGRGFVALQLAGGRGLRVDHLLGIDLRKDLEDVVLLRRLLV